MNRYKLIAVPLAVLVAGCAVRVGPPESITVGKNTITMSGLEGFDAGQVRRPDPHNPNVFITDQATIVVDQEPVRPTQFVAGQMRLAWALDAASDYSFPDDRAISIPGTSAPTNFSCAVRMPKKKVIVCMYDKPPEPKQWKYVVRVVDKNGRELTKLDPWIYQD